MPSSNASGSAKTRSISDLKHAFESAQSAEEMLKIFKKLEERLDEKQLGRECWTLAQKFCTEGNNPEKILCFGKRALKTLIDSENQFRDDIRFAPQAGSWLIACVLHLLGYACGQLKRYDESLSYLNWSNRNLSKIEVDQSCPAEVLFPTLLTTQLELFRVKSEMGKLEEAVVHLKKILEIKEKILEEGCIELGKSYKDVSDAYLAIMNSEEALPFCLKAMEIHVKHLGQDSVEVAQLKRNLGVIYNDLRDYEKAIEQNQLAQNVLKKDTSCGADLLKAEIENGSMLIGLGRYQEAIAILKRVVSNANTDEGKQAIAFVSMAKALCGLKKFADAKKYLKLAQRLYEKKHIHPIIVAVGLGDMAVVYEKMEDFETAISVLRRLLTMPDIPQMILVKNSSRLSSLISLSQKLEPGIFYLNDAIDRLKESFGPQHCEVGYGYANMGVTLLNLRKPQAAVKCLTHAQHIIDASVGPNHPRSVKTRQILFLANAIISKSQLIIRQETVVEGNKGPGPSEEDKLDEAIRSMKLIEEKVSGLVEKSPWASHQSRDDEDFSAKNTQSIISKDRKQRSSH